MLDPSNGLSRIGLFRELPAPLLSTLEQSLSIRHHPAGAWIVEAGAPDDEVYFILEGRVRVVTVSDRGREVILAEVGAGGHVGELAALDGGPRSASVVAVSDCTVASLAGATFRDLLERHPKLSLRLLAQFAQLVRDADLRIMELLTTGTVARLCRLLLREARPDRHGELVVADLPTQEVLAAETGTTRETVGKVMVELSRAGLARRVGRTLVLEQPDRLRQLARLEEAAPPAGTRAREA